MRPPAVSGYDTGSHPRAVVFDQATAPVAVSRACRYEERPCSQDTWTKTRPSAAAGRLTSHTSGYLWLQALEPSETLSATISLSYTGATKTPPPAATRSVFPSKA